MVKPRLNFNKTEQCLLCKYYNDKLVVVVVTSSYFDIS